MIDTSAMVAALVSEHAFHDVARPHLASRRKVPAIVLAETYSQLRRTFGFTARETSELVGPWMSAEERIAPTSPAGVTRVHARVVELDLGGNIHDALVAATCQEHSLPLVTLDRRQHTIALAFGVESTLLLPQM